MIKQLALLLLLAGCNNDGSFHLPLSGPDYSLSPAMKQRQDARLAICNDMQGASQESIDDCKAVATGPETGGGQTYTICTGMCTGYSSVTVYGP